MAENKDKEGSSGSQKKIRWDDEMVDKLIDLYEPRPFLWDNADPTYSKRNVKENALSETKEQLGMEISLVGPRFFLSSSKMRAITKQAAALHSDILL